MYTHKIHFYRKCIIQHFTVYKNYLNEFSLMFDLCMPQKFLVRLLIKKQKINMLTHSNKRNANSIIRSFVFDEKNLMRSI